MTHHLMAAKNKTAIIVALICASSCTPLTQPTYKTAPLTKTQTLTTTIVDVGAGLCSITETHDSKYIIYDAGNWNGGQCFSAAKRIVKNNPIDLMIISHTDSDHIGDAAKIISHFDVKKIYRNGLPRDTKSWKQMDLAIQDAKKRGLSEINLQDTKISPNQSESLGETGIEILYGKDQWLGLSPSENLNAVSIVAKISYMGQSILFTGDTIGRRLNDKPNSCKDAEAAMVKLDSEHRINLKSDIMIAGHHGGDNSNSNCFIEKVKPTFVIFPAGHKHGHPTLSTYLRFINLGVKPENIFRTDLYDREDDPDEWQTEAPTGCTDTTGDDDIEIKLGGNRPTVNYSKNAKHDKCKIY